MKRLTLLITIITSLSVSAQQGSVKGKLNDTLSKQPVPGATITLMTAKDSSLVSFTMSDASGAFAFSNITNGSYRILITHINFHNVSRPVTISNTEKEVDMGPIPMGDKFKTLNEIVVEAEAPPVTLKADTVEYNAGSFKVQPNASVEDMLRKLPGVKVDKDGTVRAQGQKVNRVLVDGKEFFGTDPKIATRNLPADAVDKVQVYDRRSDQAQLTGFDDGNSEKSINLKLKKDKKKGLFGKMMAGGGTDERYEGRFNVNSFKNEQQLSAIGMANNTNTEGFTIMDILSFNGGGQMQQSGGSVSVSITADDPAASMINGNNANNGINTTRGLGLNYNDMLGKNTDLRSNLFYNSFSPYVDRTMQRQYILPDSSYFYNSRSITENLNNNYRLNVSLEQKFDSSTSLKITPSFTYQNSSYRSRSLYSTLSEKLITANEGVNTTEGESSGFNFRNEALFRKKFKRKGRTFSAQLTNTINEADGDGEQRSINAFFQPDGSLLSRDTINQQNEFSSNDNGYNARATYTEPLGKRMLMEISVANSSTRSASIRNTYDFNSNSGKFDEINDLLSNNFNSRYGYTSAGAKLRYQRKKYNLALGAQWQRASLEGNVATGNKDTLISQQFHNILPNARFQYDFNRFRNLNLSYFSNTNQPTVTQLQPVADISNPLNIRFGNPSLKQEFIQMMNLGYMSVTPYKSTNFFAFLSLRTVSNRISTSDSINAVGVKYSIPVNVNGVYRLSGDLNWGFPLKAIRKTSLNLGLNGSIARDIQFINGNRNSIRNLQLRPELRVESNAIKNFNWGISYSSVLYSTDYSLQPSLDISYLTQEFGSFVNWQLPKNFFLATDIIYTVNSGRAEGFNRNVALWNASISKQFLKNNRAEVKLRVSDMLNQNIGISRTSNNNFIEDTRTNIIRRYFMLGFTYSLSKAGLGTGAQQGGMIRITR